MKLLVTLVFAVYTITGSLEAKIVPGPCRSLNVITNFDVSAVASEHHSYSTNDGLFATKLGFRLQLQSLHFGGPVPSPGNSLVLRCTAQIGNFYQEYTEIELGVPQRDPIPARVTSSSATDFKKCKPTIPQLIIATLLIVTFSQNIHHMLLR